MAAYIRPEEGSERSYAISLPSILYACGGGGGVSHSMKDRERKSTVVKLDRPQRGWYTPLLHFRTKKSLESETEEKSFFLLFGKGKVGERPCSSK